MCSKNGEICKYNLHCKIYSQISKYTVKVAACTKVCECVRACLCVTHSVSTVHTSTTYWHTHWFINNVHLGSTHWPGRFTAHSPDACVRLHQRALYFSLFLLLSAVPASQSIPQPSYLCSLSLYCPPPPIHTHTYCLKDIWFSLNCLSLGICPFHLARCIFFTSADHLISWPVVYLLYAR